tara:strand:- start:459 stop:1259 length:801 start_codon:yes stop_codon:yes gene_type:complete
MFKLLFSIITFFILITSSHTFEYKGSFTQGGLIIGKVDKNSIIYVNNNRVKTSKKGMFVFGISRNRTSDFLISIRNDKYTHNFSKKIKTRKFKIQRIDGLPKRKVTPNKEDMKRIRKEGKLISKAKKKNSDLLFFFESFIRPLDGITTGVYGSQRILNGKPRRPHYGIDIAAKKGTKIKNANFGRVVMSEKNLFFTGGTIIIDHGHGLVSIYSHLDQIFVKKGQLIDRGKIIATVGSTGRSTGPHLDFRLYCNNVPVDPDLIFSKN